MLSLNVGAKSAGNVRAVASAQCGMGGLLRADGGIGWKALTSGAGGLRLDGSKVLASSETWRSTGSTGCGTKPNPCDGYCVITRGARLPSGGPGAGSARE